MRRPPDIPARAGTFMLIHEPSKHVYVNETRNLKERAAIWSSHFNAFDRDGTPIRVRSWPRDLKATTHEWEFRFSIDVTVSVETLQTYLELGGWTVIKSRRAAAPVLYAVDGVEATLHDHCKRRGIKNWAAVYKRVERGMTAEKALGSLVRSNRSPVRR